MIVRNEASVICRCLESVRPYISFWTICDTGSTDGSPDLIEKFMAAAEIPGNLYRDEWLNFGHNRTLAIERAQGTGDYHLLLDADMVFHFNPISGLPAVDVPERMPSQKELFSGSLYADAYLIPFEGPIDYSVVRLVSDKHRWRFIGRTHEYVFSDTAGSAIKLDGASVEHRKDGGARNDKYERDIRLLTEEFAQLESELNHGANVSEESQSVRRYNLARTAFYLAQSFQDAGCYEKALDWYEKRVVLGGWEEETWSALYQLGRIQELLGYDWRVVLNSYLQAYNFRPSRLEPVYRIAKFYREHQQWALGYHFARLVTEVGYPNDILFVMRPVYEHLLVEEYAICCRETGRVEEALRVEQILKNKGFLTPGKPVCQASETSSVSSPVCAA